MPKSYTDELAEWVKKREATRPRQDKNVVAFLAIKSDVKAAMAAGYSRLTIWEHLHEKGKIPYRYETFLKHVRRHIKNQPAATEGTVSLKPGTSPGAAPSTAPNANPKKAEKPGFKFNPSPKKEDLL